MKKNLLTILLISLVTIIATSCRKVSHNGDLDGQWQMQSIGFDDGTSLSGSGIYYNFMLHTAQLQSSAGGIRTGNMIYEKDKSIFIEFPSNTAWQFDNFGLCSDDFKSATKGVEIIFIIRKITRKEMVLTTPSGRILNFRKY